MEEEDDAAKEEDEEDATEEEEKDAAENVHEEEGRADLRRPRADSRRPQGDGPGLALPTTRRRTGLTSADYEEKLGCPTKTTRSRTAPC